MYWVVVGVVVWACGRGGGWAVEGRMVSVVQVVLEGVSGLSLSAGVGGFYGLLFSVLPVLPPVR
jgi:hypothetical protein